MSWISKLFYGVDLDAEQDRSNAADAQLDQLNRQEIDRGRYDTEIQAQIDANKRGLFDAELQENAGNYHANVDSQVNDQFAAGAREGFDNTVGAVFRTVRDGALGIARGVPWWVWVALIVAAFLYLGGLGMIRRRVARL